MLKSKKNNKTNEKKKVAPPAPPANLQTPKKPFKNENPQQQQQSGPIKRIIQYQAEWRCKSLSDIAYISKCKPKMVSKVQLTHINAFNIGDIGIRQLRKALVDNKRTEFLGFTKSQWPDPYAEHLHHLLYCNNHLKGVSLAYDNYDGKIIGKKEVKKLLRLSRCRNLSSLDINCFLWQSIAFVATLNNFAS